MQLYRAKDIGDSKQLTETCLRIIRSGKESDLLAILPHISILRSQDLVEPLLELLERGSSAQKEAAALALANLADEHVIRALRDTLMEAVRSGTKDAQSLQTAVVVALGETGKQASVEALKEIYSFNFPRDHYKSQRRQLIISSLGRLAQQGVASALQQLLRILDSSGGELRAEAVAELATSFWHQPNQIPEMIVRRIFKAAREDEDKKVRDAAQAALKTLRGLGSQEAASCLDQA